MLNIIQMQQPNPSYWCKFESFDQASFLIVSGVLMAQCLLLCLFLRTLSIRTHHAIPISPSEQFLFKVLAVWFVFAVGKSIINIVVYALYENGEEEYSSKGQIVMAAFCLFFDKMGSFSLHTIFMKIPCVWVRNTVLRLDGEQLTMAQRKHIDLVFRVLRVIEAYLKIRYIFVLVNIAFDIYFIFEPDFGQHSGYLTMITMAEAFFAILTYTFGIASLYQFKELIHFPSRLTRKVVFEYSLLLLCCLARLTFNFLLFFSPTLNRYQPSSNCLNVGPHSLVLNYVYLSLGYSIMHIMPILSFIIIYEPEIENDRVVESLLSTSKNSRDNFRVTAQNYLLGGDIEAQTCDSAYSDTQQVIVSK